MENGTLRAPVWSLTLPQDTAGKLTVFYMPDADRTYLFFFAVAFFTAFLAGGFWGAS